MKSDWRAEVPHWVLLAGMFLLGILSWGSVPERVPVHWGLDGHVDRYGGRIEGLIGLPLLALGMYALLRWLPRIDPGRANYERFAGAYSTIRLSLTAFLSVTFGLVLLAARGLPVDLEGAIPLLLGGLFLLLGNVMGKIRPNWFVGIRTPWTLSSKRAWDRTHRLGGWMLMANGLVFLAGGSLHSRWATLAGIVALLAVSLFLILYSYRVWRTDPERIPPAGTSPG